MDKVAVTSVPVKKNTIIMITAITFFGILSVLDIARFLTLHVFEPAGAAVNLIFLIVLFNRIRYKYTCELNERALIFYKSGLWGGKRCEVNLQSVMGIYRYQPKFVELIRFRHTARLHSALDGRDVWTLAYTAVSKKGKTENCRIYFKPDDLFMEALHRRLPGKVTANDEKVVLAAMRRAG